MGSSRTDLAVIGGGQLARMMQPAAIGLGIHLRLLAEAPDGQGDDKEFEHLLTDVPSEYAGLPLAAEGARLTRYQK